MKKKRKKQKKRQTSLILLFCLSVVLVIAGYFLFIMRDIPSVKVLKHLENKPSSAIYGINGEMVYLLVPDNRIFVSYNKIPKYVRDAFLAAEDADFFKHGAIDFTGILRAFVKNLTSGRVVQGGSTITQQVVKSMILGPEKSISRKVREAVLAYRLEHYLTKQEILNLYLNNIYMGHGVFGVEAASQVYFGKHIWEISRAEAALIAGIVQAPSRYTPKRHPGGARVRQEYVISQMFEKGFIDEKRRKEMLKEGFHVREDHGLFKDSYYKDYVLRYVEERYGKGVFSRRKLKVYAAVDGQLQRAAEEAVRKGLDVYGQRKGEYLFVSHLDKKKWHNFARSTEKDIGVKGLSQGRTYRVLIIEKQKDGYRIQVGKESGTLRMDTFPFAAGDVTRAIYNGQGKKKIHMFQPVKSLKVEGSLLCMDVNNGYVYAMVGGRDFETSPYNRAISARVQSGSAFKPFIYATALKKGYGLDSYLVDEPKSYGSWTPKNYDGKYDGLISIRDAVAYSKNAATVRLLEEVGIAAVKETVHDLGIESEIQHDLSIALGTSTMTLLDLVKGFAAFANDGYRVKPIFIVRIEDGDGNILETSQVSKERAIPEDVARKMNILLKGPTGYGTAKGASRLGYPVAGKTGTTSNYYDALFVGYSPYIATGVWVGFDTRTSLGKGESGGKVCLPIWMHFMGHALRRYPPDDFPSFFEMPIIF